MKRPWTLVAMRELMVRLTDKTFVISVVSTVFILGLVFGANAFMANRSHHFDVATSTPAATQLVQKANAIAGEDKTTLTVVDVADRAGAEQAIRDGKASAYVYEDNGAWAILGDSSPESSLQSAIETVARNDVLSTVASASGRTVTDLERAMTVQYSLLNRDMEQSLFMFITGLVFAMLFYMSSIMFGMAIANSVIQEKESRIVEIIASAIPLRDLLIGKVVGNMILGFGQLLLYVAVGLIGMSFTSWKTLIPSVASGAGWFIVYFVVGFAALACVWAMAGALASRTEDLNATTTPLTMGLAVALFSGIYTSGFALKVLSYVPIASSIAMPRRLLEQDVPVWEPLVSLAISALFAVVVLRASAAVYQRALMQTGGRLTIRQAMRVER